ncbi:MAG TPA: aminoacyl-tRNA hydrolase [Candidatus Deferrimicrobium sp.]|nr:aminoacyl-tRNA hydrolase [Candidatus Deferrimicrobium sp.]
MKIVVGLGNPGSKYDGTRHNIGFLVIDNFARQHNIALDQQRCDALIGLGISHEEPLLLAKPETFMNRSGVAVAALLHQYEVTAADLVVIYDDLDLPLGRIRIRTKGSAGGHRGVSSIIEHLGGVPFNRIRIGIGRPPEGKVAIDYVLAPFGPAEMADLSTAVERSAAALGCLIHQGAAAAMAVYNRALDENDTL